MKEILNGISVVPEKTDLDKPLYTLLRKGDACIVDDFGVIRKGIVRNIINLSKGKTLISVELTHSYTQDSAVYNAECVSPADEMQCLLRLTSYDMILRRYEPKGQSTNVPLWN